MNSIQDEKAFWPAIGFAAVAGLIAFVLIRILSEMGFFPAAFIALIVAIIVFLIIFLSFRDANDTAHHSNMSNSAGGSDGSGQYGTNSNDAKSGDATAGSSSMASGNGASTSSGVASGHEAAATSADTSSAKDLGQNPDSSVESSSADTSYSDMSLKDVSASDGAGSSSIASSVSAAGSTTSSLDAAGSKDITGDDTNSSEPGSSGLSEEGTGAKTPEPMSKSADEGADEGVVKAAKPKKAGSAKSATATKDSANADLGEDYDGDGVREGTNEGTQPKMLSAARDGGADNLKEIKGVGPKMEQLLNSLGVYHFDQVSQWTADEVAWVDANLKGFKGRVSRDNWVDQAKILATGGETEFSKRVDKGSVY